MTDFRLIYQVIADALPEIGEPQIEPAVAPVDSVVFDEETDHLIKLRYISDAFGVQNFEQFQQLIQKVIDEMGLDQISSAPKIASLLNSMRIEKELSAY